MVIKIKANTATGAHGAIGTNSASGAVSKPQDARMSKLTARQQEIFALIEQSIIRTGYPPTRAEIAASLGFRSVNAAEEHLQALARKGVIELTPGASRGIRLLHAVAAPMLPTPLFLAPKLSDSRGGGAAAEFAQLAMLQSMALPLALPLIGRVAAGLPMLAQEHVDRVYQVEASLFSKKPDFLLKVHGMSMQGAGILDGDLLAVKQAKDAVNGQIVVARIDQEVTVKRFKRRGAVIELLPENPDFQTIVVDERGGEFSLEGIAVGLIRSTPLM